MNQFKQIILEEVSVSGFRGFKEEKVFSFVEGKNAFIGENGEGKSSIGELITWVLTGKNSFGKTKDLNIINSESKSAMGKVVFKDENGETHEVERKLTSTTTIKFDKKRITQKNLDELIQTDLFLLIFNPMFFLSLDSLESRQVILSLLPEITKEEVLGSLSAKERTLLESESFDINDTNKFLIDKRKSLAELDDVMKHIEGFLAKLEEEKEIKIPEERTFNNAEIEAVEKQIDALLDKKPHLQDLTHVLNRKAELEKMLVEVKSKRFESDSIKRDLLNRKGMLEQQIKMEQETTYQGFDSSKLDLKVAVLRNDYKNIDSQNKMVIEQGHRLNAKKIHFHEGESCPSCKQVITKQVVDTLNQELNIQVGQEKAVLEEKYRGFVKTLADLELEGKQLVAEIQNAKKKDAEVRAKFEETKNRNIEQLLIQVNTIDNQLANLTKDEKVFNDKQFVEVNTIIQQIEDLKINTLQQKNEAIQLEFNQVMLQEKRALKAKLEELRKEQQEFISYEANRQTILKRIEIAKGEIESKHKEMDDIKKTMTLLKKSISAMKSFNAQKIILVNNKLSMYLVNVSLKLEKTIQSTGEIKDCLELLYNDKDLKVCSTSESIKAGLELSNMITKLSGFDYPVFIDNSESITSYVSTATQLIETKVVKGKHLSMMQGTKEIQILSVPESGKVVELDDEKMDDIA